MKTSGKKMQTQTPIQKPTASLQSGDVSAATATEQYKSQLQELDRDDVQGQHVLTSSLEYHG